MKVTMKLHVYHSTNFDGSSKYDAWHGEKLDPDVFGIYVGPVEFDYHVPEDFNPVASEVVALEAKKSAALEDYQRTVAQINERLSKLQAITAG